ncbi:hypothetical protein V501_03607 [Pseudogymnoascus sp. VKM F-4519 (FW-2642)]|nr:hypothetical protein V501_03607 [Pseudogymnoascus sp. VKM F-4519 (FW-2642)]
MHFNKILALFILATAATTAPVEDLEARAPTCPTTTIKFCCKQFVSLSLFSITGVGQDCIKVSSTTTCPATRAKFPPCCARPVFDGTGLVCFAA